MSSVLLLGATGLVGSEVLKRLLVDDRFGRVIAPVRRPLQLQADKLLVPVVDFDALPEDRDWWDVDAIVCTLGTTIRKAGSKPAFRRVDHDIPLKVAELARRQNASTFVLVSAGGADAASRFFYLRTKGELEEDLAKLGFPSLTLVRPGLIAGERAERRFIESASSMVLGLLGTILPRSLRLNPVAHIAAAVVEAAAARRSGAHVVSSGDLA